MADRQEFPDSENRPTVDKPDGRRGPGQKAKRTGECRFDMTNVKCGVNTHGPGETQMDRDRVNHFGYGKGTNEPGGELTRFHPEWQILGGQPHFIACGVTRSRQSLPICRSLIGGGLPQEVLAHSLPGPLAVVNQRQGRWDRIQGLLRERERVDDHGLYETGKNQMMQKVKSYEQAQSRPVVMTRCQGVVMQ